MNGGDPGHRAPVAAVAFRERSVERLQIDMIKAALQKLLNRLDGISENYEEVNDTDVREQMAEAIYHGFIVQTPGYTLPAEFGMFQPAGDAAVRRVLADFLPEACAAGIATARERFAAFQDISVVSDAGNPYEEYFGYSDSFDELMAAMSPPTKPPVTPPTKPWWQFWG